MSKIIKLYMKSKGKYKYDAQAEYNKGKVIVKKGSILNPILAESEKFKFSSKLSRIRTDKDFVKENVLLKDIEFQSATKAGIFVCGYSVNGMDRWKTEDRKKLKEIVGDKR